MSETDKTFRDKLMDMEKASVGSKQEYERQVQTMVEKKISRLWRVVFAALAVVGLLVALPFGGWAFSNVGCGMGCFLRIFIVSGFIVALLWAILMGWIAIRGRYNSMTQPPRIVGLGIVLGFFCIVAFLFVYIIPITLHEPMDRRSILGIQLSIMGFSFLVIVGLCVVLSVLYRTEFQTREKLLEIEYYIAELAERMEGKSSK